MVDYTKDELKKIVDNLREKITELIHAELVATEMSPEAQLACSMQVMNNIAAAFIIAYSTIKENPVPEVLMAHMNIIAWIINKTLGENVIEIMQLSEEDTQRLAKKHQDMLDHIKSNYH